MNAPIDNLAPLPGEWRLLVSRIEAGNVSDGSILRDIFRAFGLNQEWRVENSTATNNDALFCDRVSELWDAGGAIDACIALCERVLPEWQIISFMMGWRGPGKLHDHLPETWRKRYAKADLEIACVAHVRRSEHSYVSATAEAPTPARALLAAIVKARMAELGVRP